MNITQTTKYSAVISAVQTLKQAACVEKGLIVTWWSHPCTNIAAGGSRGPSCRSRFYLETWVLLTVDIWYRFVVSWGRIPHRWRLLDLLVVPHRRLRAMKRGTVECARAARVWVSVCDGSGAWGRVQGSACVRAAHGCICAFQPAMVSHQHLLLVYISHTCFTCRREGEECNNKLVFFPIWRSQNNTRF